jgi:superfamily II DNA or RNA helicase
MSATLREYQHDIISEARGLMRQGIKSILIQSPTGSGKTLLTAHMLGTASGKGLHCWFMVHRRELIKQSISTFAQVGIKHGVVAAGWYEEPHLNVQLASVQTVARRVDRIKNPKLIVWDEAHHVAAGSWSKIHAAFPDAFHIGLTATPERLDGTGLKQWFKAMVKGPAVRWLIDNKFLSEYKIYAPPSINTTDIHSRMGDFVKSELSAAIDKPTITGDAIRHYQKYGMGKRAVCFCVSIEHSQHVAKQFMDAGIEAVHVDGESSMEHRDQSIERFRKNEIKVLTNVDLFGEGFDLPALEVAILLRPTQSLGLYLQQVGRALRPFPGKSHAVILDHAGNCARFGLPDEERDWSLEPKDKKSRASGSSANIRICPKCFAAQTLGSDSCKFCGFEFEKSPRQVDQVEGELEEVDAEALRRHRNAEQGKAQSLQELIAVGKSRGYQRPEAWARYVWRARMMKGKAA